MKQTPQPPAFQDRLNTITRDLYAQGYICEEPLAAALSLMDILGRPLLLEGDAGVGKTAVANALAGTLDTELIRLQCYEGLDIHNAAYEWNVQRQFLEIRLRQNDEHVHFQEEDLFSEKFLLKRPLLKAITAEKAPVLLIDEIDRADEEFEAFLLEILSEFQLSIPELGHIQARQRPHVILTANGTRELSDALRRRCLYLLLDYPSAQKEREILKCKLPGLDDRLCAQIVDAVNRIRHMDLRKSPGVAETLDWAAALLNMGIETLHKDTPWLNDSLACLLKTREDRDYIQQQSPATWLD